MNSVSTHLTREQLISSIIERCRQRLAIGKELIVDQIVASFPELAPDLSVRLQIAIELELTTPRNRVGDQTDTKLSKHSSSKGSFAGIRQPLIIDTYQVVRELGRGGMGVVYEAIDSETQERVAVKTLHPAAISEEECQRFLLESRLAQQLSHPHIVPVFRVGEADGVPFLVMKVIDGIGLDRLCRRSPLPAQISAKAIRQIAEALNCAHEQGVLHRDIKPSNIIVDVAGTAYLTDFGLAKLFGSATLLTKTGQTLGTPNFMSPEQALGEKEKIGPASDLYSLGATLYNCLTGEPPFQGEHFAATLVKAITQEPIPISQLNPNVDRRLEQIVKRCMQRDPAARFGSISELIAAISAVEHEPVEVLSQLIVDVPVPTQRTAKPEGGRRKLAFIGWGICAAVLLMLLARVPEELRRLKQPEALAFPQKTVLNPTDTVLARNNNDESKDRIPQPKIEVERKELQPKINRAPQIIPLPDVALKYGDLLKTTVIAIDLDGDVVVFSLSKFPENAKIDKTGKISWSPNKSDAGKRHDFIVSVSDSKNEPTECRFSVSVASLPLSPILRPINPITLDRGRSVSVDLRVDRRDWTGPIEVGSTGLPTGIQANRITIPAGKDNTTISLSADKTATATTSQICFFSQANDEVDTQTVRLNVKKPAGLELIYEETGNDPKACQLTYDGFDKGGSFRCAAGIMSTTIKKGSAGGPGSDKGDLYPDKLSLDDNYQCEIRLRVRPFTQNSFVNFGCATHFDFEDPTLSISSDILDWSFFPNSTMNCQRRIWTPISISDRKKGTQNTRTDNLIANLPSGSLLNWQTLAIKLERNRVSWLLNNKLVATKQMTLTGRNGETLKGSLSFFLSYNHLQANGGTIDLDHVRLWRIND